MGQIFRRLHPLFDLGDPRFLGDVNLTDQPRTQRFPRDTKAMPPIDSEAANFAAPLSPAVTHQYPTDLPVLSETVSHREEPSTAQKHEVEGETLPSTSPEQFYPEGGREAWFVVFGSFCGMVASFGVMNTIGTFQTHLASNELRSYSEGQIGWIFGVYAFISFFGGIQIGIHLRSGCNGERDPLNIYSF